MPVICSSPLSRGCRHAQHPRVGASRARTTPEGALSLRAGRRALDAEAERKQDDGGKNTSGNHVETDDITSGAEAPRARAGTCLQREAPWITQKPHVANSVPHAISLVTVASLSRDVAVKVTRQPRGRWKCAATLNCLRHRVWQHGHRQQRQRHGARECGKRRSRAGRCNEILVLQTAQGSFKAFTAVCTHEQNIITGFQNNNTFVCPAHGSQFNTSGGVVQGPATRALREFPTQFTNNVLTITV